MVPIVPGPANGISGTVYVVPIVPGPANGISGTVYVVPIVPVYNRLAT